MKPVEFAEANMVLTPPQDVSEEDCGRMHAYKTGDGRMISCWELSGTEMMNLLQSGRIWLHVWGEKHPPVAVEVDSPFIGGVVP